ncbi:MAG: cell division protein FtsQ [Pseudomonadota bacterium]
MWDNPTLLKNTSTALFVVSVLLLLMGALHYALHLPTVLPIRSVRLAAVPVHVDAEQVLQVVRNGVRGNFFTVDIEQLRAELEKLAWVRQVNIRREFPNRLSVELAEHQALAHVGQTGYSAQLAEQYALCNTQLQGIHLQVRSMVQSPRFAWQVRLDNGMVLELGSSDMQARLARFVAVYPYSLVTQQNTVRTVDLRYRNGFAVSGLSKQS